MKFIRGWRKHIGILCALLVVMVMIIMTASNNKLQDETVTLFDRITYPVQWFFLQTSNFCHSINSYFGSKAALVSENERLKEEILELKEIEMQMKELQRENNSLKQILGYTQAEKEMTLEVADIIYRDPNNWYRQIVINIGENDGIMPGMTVIAIQEYQVGLVGIVEKVYPHTARVQLIVDPMKSIATAAQVQGYSEDLHIEPIWYQGIVEGSNQKQGKMEMFYITHEANIETDASVITTGLGGHYVADIPIGYIETIELDGYGLLKRAIVKPYIDFNRLKEVIIVTDPYPLTDERGVNE